MSASRLRRVLSLALPPIVFGVLFLLAWEWFVEWRNIKRYILPKPSEIWDAGSARSDLIRKSMGVTGTNAFIGLLAGIVIGTLLALLTSRFRVLAELVSPLEVAARTIPIVVIVAVLNNMFALDTETARRIMVTIAVFFIVYVNVTKGLLRHDPVKTELLRSYAATPRQLMRKVRIPNALPYFFTGIRIAAPVAVITAFVAEYFGGLQNGLGYRITSSFSSGREPLGWAAVGGACLLGLLFFTAAAVLESVAVPWQRRRTGR